MPAIRHNTQRLRAVAPVRGAPRSPSHGVTLVRLEATLRPCAPGHGNDADGCDSKTIYLLPGSVVFTILARPNALISDRCSRAL